MVASVREVPLRFLVIGCGSIGKRHISNLIALNMEDILAFDVRNDRRDEVESRFGIATLDNLEDAWGHRPDVALITVPSSLHIPLALQAAKHGCHLFIEKPLSDRMEGVDVLLEVVRERNLVTLVGCNMRFHPGLVKIKSLLNEDAIGKVIAARVEVGQYLPDWHPWEDYRKSYSANRSLGGGVILDAIHEIDYIRWLLGEVREVFCFADKLSALEIDTEDTAAILMRFENGIIGEVHMDYVQRAYSRTCRIIGEEGTILWDFTDNQVKLYLAKAQEWKVFKLANDFQLNQMYVEEMRHFLRCLSGKGRATLDVFEAKSVLEIALAAKKSAEVGKKIDIKKGRSE